MATSVYELCRDCGISAEQLSEESGLVRERITAIILGRWTPSPSARIRGTLSHLRDRTDSVR